MSRYDDARELRRPQRPPGSKCPIHFLPNHLWRPETEKFAIAAVRPNFQGTSGCCARGSIRSRPSVLTTASFLVHQTRVN